ncbi:class I lanthipeptide [Kordia jejudonensis]|uniref:class I lanthipeptide n=1 Tax=Kordia jejudonensis TaxID=1348245 RepID=UPI000628FF79|nr:class I lanthipeptide [Kordia jejudonensis]
MKKRSIQKLKLNKKAVSSLTANALAGGTLVPTQICLSFNFCETLDYTACNGEFFCQIYDSPQR